MNKSEKETDNIMTDEISKLQTEPAAPAKKYEACKQKSGSGDNEISILMSDFDKAKIYTHVRELRKNNQGDGFHYWMRPVQAPELPKELEQLKVELPETSEIPVKKSTVKKTTKTKKKK